MARSFTTASSMYLENATAPAIGYTGCSMCCWATRTVDVVESALLIVGVNDTSGNYVGLHMNPDGRSRAYTYAAGASSSATAGTVGGALNTWNFYGATFTSATARSAYWNTATATNAVSRIPTGALTGTVLGRRMGSTRLYHGGLIAEAALYNAVLSAADMLQLASMVSPLLVRPESLVAYWPLLGEYSPEIDIISQKKNLTLFATPPVAAHVPIIYKAPPFIIAPPLAAASIAPLARHYQQMRRM